MTETDLSLEGLEYDEVEAFVGGLCFYQTHAISALDIPKANAAGRTLRKVAEQNPDAVRRTLLENRDSFQVASMPDDLLEQLDIEVQAGRVQDAGGDEPAAVEVDDAE